MHSHTRIRPRSTVCVGVLKSGRSPGASGIGTSFGTSVAVVDLCHKTSSNRLPFRMDGLSSGFVSICNRRLADKLPNRSDFRWSALILSTTNAAENRRLSPQRYVFAANVRAMRLIPPQQSAIIPSHPTARRRFSQIEILNVGSHRTRSLQWRRQNAV